MASKLHILRWLLFMRFNMFFTVEPSRTGFEANQAAFSFTRLTIWAVWKDNPSCKAPSRNPIWTPQLEESLSAGRISSASRLGSGRWGYVPGGHTNVAADWLATPLPRRAPLVADPGGGHSGFSACHWHGCFPGTSLTLGIPSSSPPALRAQS